VHPKVIEATPKRAILAFIKIGSDLGREIQRLTIGRPLIIANSGFI
jgi:hypothetical protein